MEVNNNESRRGDWEKGGNLSQNSVRNLSQVVLGNVCIRDELLKAQHLCFCECVQITDPSSQRYEVPHQHVQAFTGPAATGLNYKVELQQNPFGIIVSRVSNSKVL